MISQSVGRRPNGASTVYLGGDGNWHGRVTVGIRDDGKPDRRHFQAKTQGAIIKKVRTAERQRETGITPRTGRPWTVERWLVHWVDNIAAPVVRQNTIAGYRVAVQKHLIPGVGAHRLDKLEPEHLERLYARMLASGSSPGTAHQAHRTIRTSLGEALRRGHISRNPAALAKPPRLTETEIEPYSVEDVQRLLAEAGKGRNRARWDIALALGLRQGEVLGLTWADIDLDTGTLWVRRARLRPTYAHGCGGGCGRKPGFCAQRVATRPATDDTKSRAGRRVIGIPAALLVILREHREQQARERDHVGQLWREGGWVFTSPTGAPINPNTDYHEWKRLLVAAGLRDGRLHDARHTAATVLLLLGVPERAVMGLMGWSTTAMAARYQHITEPVRRDVAARVGGLIWALPAGPGGRLDEPN